MGLYCGIDLHSDNAYYGIVDAEGRRVYKKRLPNELPVVLEALAPFKEELTGLAVESTYNWYWLVDGLQAKGYPMQLANPAGMEQYSGLKHAADSQSPRRPERCVLLGGDAALGDSAEGLHLSERRTSGSRFVTSPDASGATEDGAASEFAVASQSRDGSTDHRQSAQTTERRGAAGSSAGGASASGGSDESVGD